jgi:predicted esterase
VLYLVPSLGLFYGGAVEASGLRCTTRIAKMELNPGDPTLDLPRILCLHGGGTNARIFRAQCRVLERALTPTYRLCFAEGPFLSPPGPDVTVVYGHWGPFRAWLQTDPEVLTAVDEMLVRGALERAMADDAEKGATGAWVGLLGFSQGAKICANLLYSQQLCRPEASAFTAITTVRFAILMAGRGPLSARDEGSEPGPMAIGGAPTTNSLGRSGGHLLQMPSVHVHGLQDPGLELHRRLLHQYCDPRSARVVEWEGV